MKMNAIKWQIMLFTFFGCALAALGLDGSWTNQAGNWSAGGNWRSGTIADGAGYTAFFTNDVTSNRAHTNDGTRTIGNLEFSDNGASSYTRTLGGSSVLTLSMSGGTSEIRWLTPVEIFAPLAGSDDVLFSGTSVGLSGTPALKMKGTNAYAGATILRRGTLTASGHVPSGANSPLGNASSAVQIGDAGTLSTDNLQLMSEGTGANFGRSVVVNNTGNMVAIGNLAVANDPMIWSGDITLNRTVWLASRANLGLSGKITGSGGFIRTSSDNNGSITLQGSNDFSGDITISRGILVAAHPFALGTATTPILLGDTNSAANTVSLRITNGITLTREIVVSSNATGMVSIGPNYNGTMGAYSGKITLERTLTIAPKTGGSTTVASPIVGTGGLTFMGNSDGYTYLTCETNSFSGNVMIANGILVVSNEVRKNQNSPLGNSGSAILLQAPSSSSAIFYIDSNGEVDRDFLVTNTTITALIGTRTATNLVFTSSLTVSNPLVSVSPVNATNSIEWAGAISGSGVVQKSGAGVLILSGTNSAFGGAVYLYGGTLRLNSPVPLGAGPFRFAATGTRLENNFAPYVLTNGIEIVREPNYYGMYDLVFTGDKKIMGNLGDTPITVNQTNVLLGFQGNLTSYDQGTLTKKGAGFLEWGGTNLTANFTNTIIINAGVFRAYEGVGISTQSTIRFTGGVWESTGLCTRALGTGVGAGQVSWGAGSVGGFSAYGEVFTVNLGGAAATVSWAANNFVGINAEFVLGSERADRPVVFKNRIDVNGGTRSIRVYDNPAVITDKAFLEGGVDLGSHGIAKNGLGVLALGGVNSGTAAVIVNEGVLLMEGELVASATAMQCKTNTWLGGRGTIKRSITLDPGFGGFEWADAPGTLTVQTNLTLPKGLTYNFRRLVGQVPLVDVTGTLTISNGVTVNVFGDTHPELTLFTAGALAGVQNLADWVVTGSSKPYTVKVKGLSIIATCPASGTIIQIN
jgi:autotransporter-associated beta strand protein